MTIKRLIDVEKENLLNEYKKWKKFRLITNKKNHKFYAPVAIDRETIVREMRFVHNTPLKFVPAFFMLELARFMSTFGRIAGLQSIENIGHRLLRVLSVFTPM